MSKQIGAIKKIIELCLVTSSIVFFCLPYVYGQSRDTPASIKPGNLKPTYPSMSKRLNEQGSVILRVLVKSDGSVGSIEIKSSSDYPRIDQAAVDAVRNWQFNPATRNGSPIDEWYQIPISMYLKDEATVVTRVEPVYPPLSLQFGEQGIVILRFLVKNDGTVGTINVKTTSGFPRLDQAAEDALKKWRFNPATTGGKPVDEWYEVRIPFSNELADNKKNSKIISTTSAELSEVVTDSGKDVPNSRNRSEKNDIDRERQQLAEERRKLDEEKRKREQAKSGQRINLQVTHSQPNADGSFFIEIKTNADTSSLQIDGKEEGGKPDGNYVIKRVARAGQASAFKIIATDVYGNTDTKTINVSRAIVESKTTYAALNPGQVKQQTTRDAVAIIIGIADYRSLPKADFANDDARAFYDYAIRALGIKPENIKLLVDSDAEEAEILKTFRTWLPSRVKSTTDVYVFYSGHGLPMPDGKGLYLVPPRADREVIDDTAIPFSKLNAAITLAKPKSVTIFLDSCYSGQARSGETLVANARPVQLKSDSRYFPENFTVITASQNDQISSSNPELQHGIFSYYLMKGMEGDADENRDGKITLGEMQSYLAENVSRHAAMMSRKQEPQLIGDVNRVLVGR